MFERSLSTLALFAMALTVSPTRTDEYQDTTGISSKAVESSMTQVTVG